MSADPLPDWPRANRWPRPTARLRAEPEDFRVVEQLPFEASGDGEHVLLEVEKRNANTRDVATELARFAGVAPAAVGYAGLKDRRAIARQFFSVQIAGRREPRWAKLSTARLKVLRSQRHHRKLRIGALSANHFDIHLRDCTGPLPDSAQNQLSRAGVPNYFGPQRFGRDGSNIAAAKAMFAGARTRRGERGLLLSAARALLFNNYLGLRVAERSWNELIDGDVACLAGSGSFFSIGDDIDALQARLEAADVHPAGPLFGNGQSTAGGAALRLEQQIAEAEPDLLAGLQAAGLKLQRRALRLMPGELRIESAAANDYRIQFKLPSGCFATALLRELVEF